MKSRIVFSLIAILFIFSSCKKDPCEGVNCLHGVCNDGVCICESGWEGEYCTIADVDPCENVTCVNGQCVEGDCVCDAGYEGTDCGTAINAKFVGTYNVFPENCNPSGPISSPYVITISASATTPYAFTITGLWEESGASAIAEIWTTGNTFGITRQDYSNFNREIEGTGTMSSNGTSIDLYYTIYDKPSSNELDGCSSTLTKQ